MFYSKKSLGQNFLINRGVLEKIVSAAELTKDDIVVEIGPGTGNLTKLLSEKAGRVIAIEKDHRLVEMLKTELLTFPCYSGNVKVVEGDILKLDIEELFRNLKLLGEGSRVKPGISIEIRNSNYKVVGNIPYYITSHLLKTIFESASWRMVQPKLLVLMVQKEVAQRITVVRPPYNLLALSVQFYADPKIIGYVSRGSFRPMPKVDSAIISLRPKAESLKPAEKEIFFKLIKAGFSGKRKQLKNTLGEYFKSKEKVAETLRGAEISPESRPEELNMEDWLKLSKYLLS